MKTVGIGAQVAVRNVAARKKVLFGSSALLSGAMLLIGMATSVNARAEEAKGCTGTPDPYSNYACMDAYLGNGVLERLVNYYKLEMGQGAAPSDPNAPAGRRDYWPSTPVTTPPMPFTEWPYGGSTNLGVNRTGTYDSPLMAAIANTSVGEKLSDWGIQAYGWVDVGANISTAKQQAGGNWPVGYEYTPNIFNLDQAVLYIERTPDTVQKDHIDWGFRVSGIYGQNYRYTTSYGLASYQLLKKNQENGYDFPMVYGEVFFPQVLEGMNVRFGRYISLPDIEAQLAPNNYMYTHSLTYEFDNYTNTGIQTTTAITKNFFVQVGVTDGTETPLWNNSGNRLTNQLPGNPLFPGKTFARDPGNQPSYTVCMRYTWNDGNDNINPCVNAVNRGNWGYNNLQWQGITYYHKFNDKWHLSFETYYEYQNGVPNATNPAVQSIVAGGGTPFSPQFIPFNAPGLAQCKSETALRCRAHAMGVVAYLNYSPDPLNNFSLRPEIYDDPQGQRTGTKATYWEVTVGWQHWLSPQIEFRPEVGYWAANKAAFNGDANAGIAPNMKHIIVAAADGIFHF